jgi:hypothetical protein
MKMHSLSLQKKEISTPINYKTKPSQFKENNEEFHNKKTKNIIKINIKKIVLNEKNEKSQNEDSHKLKNGQKENKKVSTFNNVVPQKVLKFNKKHMNYRKNNTEKKINIYENALMDKLKFIIANTNNNYQNNSNKLNSKIKFNLSPVQKQNNLFENFKDYQKEFLSSAYNFHINENNIYNIKKYSTIEFTKDKSSLLTPNPDKTNVNFARNIIFKIPHKHSKNNVLSRPISNILIRKKHGEIPIILNSPITFIKNYKSNSEKERDEKNCKELIRLRNFLDMYWDKRNQLVTEFFNAHQVNDKEYYTLKNLENFAHYIFDNISDTANITKGIIETRIPMKEIIDKGIQYKNYSLKKMKNSNSMPVFSDINLIEHKNKNITGNNWFSSNQTQTKIKDNNTNNFPLRKSKMIENKGEINADNFHIDNYMNDKYQISDKEKSEKKILNDKIYKYKKYLDKNYGQKINNKFLKDYNQNEKINYFHKRKIGKIDIPDKKNLANNMQKQLDFYKLKSTSFSLRKNYSIHSFSENDFKELYNELNQVKENYTIFGDEKENELNDKESQEDNIWIKMYEDVKKKKFEKNPETILKKKKKLLEYIIFQHIKRRKDLEKDVLK